MEGRVNLHLRRVDKSGLVYSTHTVKYVYIAVYLGMQIKVPHLEADDLIASFIRDTGPTLSKLNPSRKWEKT